MEYGTSLIPAPFKREEVFHQGAVESGHLFALTAHRPIQDLNNTLSLNGGGALTILDDNYAKEEPCNPFPANEAFKSDLEEVGLKLNASKSKF